MEPLLDNFYVNTVIYTFWIAILSFILEFYLVYNFSVHQEHIRRQFLLMKLEDFSRIIHEIKHFAFNMSREREGKLNHGGHEHSSQRHYYVEEETDNGRSGSDNDQWNNYMHHQSFPFPQLRQKNTVSSTSHQNKTECCEHESIEEPRNNASNESFSRAQRKKNPEISFEGNIFNVDNSKSREETLKEIFQIWENFENEIHKVVLELREPMRNARKIFLVVLFLGWLLGSSIIIIEIASHSPYHLSFHLLQRCFIWILPGTLVYLPGFYFLRKATYYKLKLS